MIFKQPNRWLQLLLAVENKTILQQLKPSTLCGMFQLRLILYPHHIVMRLEMLNTNRSFEICLHVHRNGIPIGIPWEASHGIVWDGTGMNWYGMGMGQINMSRGQL